MPAEKNSVVQVKYTNPDVLHGTSIVRFTDMKRAGKYAFDTRIRATVSYQLLSPCRAQVLLFLDQIKREKGVW